MAHPFTAKSQHPCRWPMKFRRIQIEQMIEAEVAQCTSFRNWHGLTPEIFSQHLIQPPQSWRFREPQSKELLWLWTVADEVPSHPTDGCLIVFNPRRYIQGLAAFGLATKPQGNVYGTFLGYYDSLLQTLEAM
jgi:hypothetical protein